MVEQFKRTCSYCGKPIVMKKRPIGGWKAYEDDKGGITHHNCRQPYYQDPVNNTTRDKKMAPKISKRDSEQFPELSASRLANHGVYDPISQPDPFPPAKKLIEFESRKDPVQIMITELSKQTHLLTAILQILSKEDDE